MEEDSKLKNYILTTLLGGFVVILPIALLLVVFNWIFSLLFGIISPITSLFTFGGNVNVFLANVIAITIILMVCFGVGVMMKTSLGTYLYKGFENRVLARLPFYKGIKETISLFTNKEKMPFSTVVLIDAFGNDTRMTGFVTDTHENGNFTVFVPTGPNPTNGIIYHVPESQIEILDISVEDAMKSIIGVGAGSSKVVSSKNN